MDWPILTSYKGRKLARVAMPLGGIGTGTVSLGGRGDLRHWEVMNRPDKGWYPAFGHNGTSAPFFALYAHDGRRAVTRALEGPLDAAEYEGHSGSPARNHGLPRFRRATFDAAYPLAQVRLGDPDVPLEVTLEAFNPLVPCDAEASGLPVAVLRYALHNPTDRPIHAAVCGTLPNFVGRDDERPCCGRKAKPRAGRNRNRYCEGRHLRGLFMDRTGTAKHAPGHGSLALATTARRGITHRTAWSPPTRWGGALLDFWDDFRADGRLSARDDGGADQPVGSLSVRLRVPPGATRRVTFLLAWHFPNRITWSPENKPSDRIGNYYSEQHADAWAAAEAAAAQLPRLERETVRFVEALCGCDLPDAVKEAALFNLSTLRSQTCFRTPDGVLFGFEGCNPRSGCCHGSCTHVWNYEYATPFLFGGLARGMRDVEFGPASRRDGRMSFRVNLPLSRGATFDAAAADGQMGCVLKVYREWQLCGDDAWLRGLWSAVRRALAYAWIEGGWDADQDGVMEGCQHNTMDVEYYGPNPQMQGWYLGALRAAETMARHLGDIAFADRCASLFAYGSRWMDEHLFNGDYYEHEVRPPAGPDAIAHGLRVGMGGEDLADPDYQLGPGCLVDQLVGQSMAHVCDLGYLHRPAYVARTLRAIWKHNRKKGFWGHFNNMRSYVLGDEAALLMAAYPHDRPRSPFPYFTEVMTGFEYTAALGMIQEGQESRALQCVADIRARYDGERRNPFDEAECGHHYARAMASWGLVPALIGFHYSAVTRHMRLAARPGTWFWSTGDAWGTVAIAPCAKRKGHDVALHVGGGRVRVRTLELTGKHGGTATVSDGRRSLRRGKHVLRVAAASSQVLSRASETPQPLLC